MIGEQGLGLAGGSADSETDVSVGNVPAVEDRGSREEEQTRAQIYAKQWPRLIKPAAVILGVLAVAAAVMTSEWRQPPKQNRSDVTVESTSHPAPVTPKLTEQAAPKPPSTSVEPTVAKPVRITAYYVEPPSSSLLVGIVPGLHIANIEPAPDPGDGGLQVGDVILQISGQKVSSLEQAANLLDQAKAEGRSSVLFQVSSNSGETHFVGVSLKKLALTIASATPSTGQGGGLIESVASGAASEKGTVLVLRRDRLS
jgi:membrane-associated protease RseP (regulator of RpoE activity)